MLQVQIEKATQLQSLIEINEFYNEMLFQNVADNIQMIEKDYLKWKNMVSLNIIKNDDLKDLSLCLHEYHNQYNIINTLTRITQEFSGNIQEVNQQLDIRNVIIYSIELMLVKKFNLVNSITLTFEESFPSCEVIGDDKHFHQMIIQILDLIIGEQEAPACASFDQNSNNNNSLTMNSTQIKQQQQQQQQQDSLRKDIKIDCRLKQVGYNGSYVLSFDFQFECNHKVERTLTKVFEKVKVISDSKKCIQPQDLSSKNQNFLQLLLVFIYIQRLQGHYEFIFQQDEGSCENLDVSKNWATLNIEMSFRPIEMKTYYGNSQQQYLVSLNQSPSQSILKNNQKSLQNSITKKQKMNNKPFVKNSIQLILNYSRDNNKSGYKWTFQDQKQLKKIHLKSTKQTFVQKSNVSLSQFRVNNIQNIVESSTPEYREKDGSIQRKNICFSEQQSQTQYTSQASQIQSQQQSIQEIKSQSKKHRTSIQRQNSYSDKYKNDIQSSQSSYQDVNKGISFQNINSVQISVSQNINLQPKNESSLINISTNAVRKSSRHQTKELTFRKNNSSSPKILHEYEIKPQKVEEKQINFLQKELQNEDIKNALENTIKDFKQYLLFSTQKMVKKIVHQSTSFQDQNINIIDLQQYSQQQTPFLNNSFQKNQIKSQNQLSDSDTNSIQMRPKSFARKPIKHFTILDQFSSTNRQKKNISMQQSSNFQQNSAELLSYRNSSQESFSNFHLTNKLIENQDGFQEQSSNTQMINSISPCFGDKSTSLTVPNSEENNIQGTAQGELTRERQSSDLISCVRKKSNSICLQIKSRRTTMNQLDIVTNKSLNKEINISRMKTYRRSWVGDDVWGKQVYNRSNIILAYTQNSKIISALKQIAANIQIKEIGDCRFVRNNFQAEGNDSTNGIFSAVNMIRSWEQKNSIPKTYLVGIYDSQNQQVFKNQYEIIDLWLCKDQDIQRILGGDLNVNFD